MPRNIKNAGRPKKPVNLKQSFGRLFNYLKPFYNTILISLLLIVFMINFSFLYKIFLKGLRFFNVILLLYPYTLL